ncbi:dephospho-CoA kinase [Nakamurella sp. YIM 132087]|uniref:Dephospho-CoA kinase n=1 Tax=Nakamurella alba TaxID=2665158 RepID=A0A7K1FRK0_9ACTN|nr:dephospho-CoA kinase [Nakamurella alba]
MLLIAVTGGIGAGKSTVSRVLAGHGAVVIDSDRLAREVVAPGSPGLAAIGEAFGPAVLAADGSLDRPALGSIVFADPDARKVLEGITHPLVRARFAELAAAAPEDSVVVNDIPLLVSQEVAATFHLVVGVHVELATRVRRLVDRGHTEADARARIAAQIDDEARGGLCDAWIGNDGAPEDTDQLVDELWRERIVPMRNAVANGVATGWTGESLRHGSAARTVLRLHRATGQEATRVAGGAGGAPLVVELPASAAESGEALTRAGFPPVAGDADRRGPADPALNLDLRLVEMS